MSREIKRYVISPSGRVALKKLIKEENLILYEIFDGVYVKKQSANNAHTERSKNATL